ncbi:MAG: dTDP-4-dehydrorhamnose 3,5-epimerase [Flavisolibacter sp.]|nr:dTDP-4-dehydrorhamnose 3,5-epimerase [Flavisolibacter sp.]MBD0367381.1 dTDP-4-dehydrorhamnose 3,5-epimerase [Flavisolibacter sp.]MBD0377445.1 dTDP-4-dehydrorhamnose 3,5-epimerase [Flavisolibacter sp.]
MQFYTTSIDGLIIIEPKVYEDSRGYFYESYHQQLFKNNGIDMLFVQDNQSLSSYGVIRGLHYQLNPQAQAKLVRVLEGAILDVAVDIRRNSPTYGQHFPIELSAENKKQLFIPEGFAHGFSVLSETAVVLYKCNRFYHKQSEAGIRYDDVSLNIDWKVEPDKAIISEKDKLLPLFKDCTTNFDF